MPLQHDVTGVLDCWYYQFWVGADDYDFEDNPLEAGMFTPQADGSGVMVHAATHSGYVRVTLRSTPDEPAEPTDEWQDVARGSLRTETPSLFARTPLGDRELELELPRAGMFAFQISARAREDVRDDEFDPTDPAEQYLIELWPVVEPVVPTCIRVTSAFGQQRLADAAEAAANPLPSEEIEESDSPRHRSLQVGVWLTTDAALEHLEAHALADGDRAVAIQASRLRESAQAAAPEGASDDDSFFLFLSAEDDRFITVAVEQLRASAGELRIEGLDRAVAFWQSPDDFQVSTEPPEGWTRPGPITLRPSR